MITPEQARAALEKVPVDQELLIVTREDKVRGPCPNCAGYGISVGIRNDRVESWCTGCSSVLRSRRFAREAAALLEPVGEKETP
jgi:hypothetical protein